MENEEKKNRTPVGDPGKNFPNRWDESNCMLDGSGNLDWASFGRTSYLRLIVARYEVADPRDQAAV